MPEQSRPAVLIFPFDLLSHYLRCLQIAAAIRDHYDIYFAHSEKYDQFVAQAGFQSFRCEGFDSEFVIQCAADLDFSWINVFDLERVFRSQVRCIERFKPVAVLGDTAPTLKMASEATGTRYLSLMNGYMTKYYKFTRKIAAAHPAAKLEGKLPAQIFELMVKSGETLAFRRIHRPFKELRGKYGLAPFNMYLDELEGGSNLICDLPLLFPQEALPSNYHFIGPLFHASEDPEDDILDFLDNGKPSILVSMGSTGDFGKLEFLDSRDFQRFNIVVAGNLNGILQERHVLSKPFLNNCAILEKIDLVISHGGNGSMYQALAFGVPLLCLPRIFEQEWNVQRLTKLNLGSSVDCAGNARKTCALTNHWMKRKNTGELLTIRKKIDLNESKRKFRQVWMDLMEAQNTQLQVGANL